MRSWVFLFLWPVLVIALLFPSRSFAQDLTAAERKEAIAVYKARIASADTAGDAQEAARQRIMLAPLLPAAQARRVLEEAALIADSARLWGNEGLRAHQGLMDLYAGQGNWRKAFEESRTVQELQTREQQRELDLAVASERSKLEMIEAHRDSLASGWRREQEAAIAEHDRLHGVVQRWQLVLGVLLVVAVVIGIIGLALARKRRLGMEARMQQLAGEVEQLRSRMAAMVQPSAPPTPVVQTVVTDPVPMPVAPEVGEDSLLLGMLRKQAPERLRALREARLRMDHAKAQRVVHTLKPLLVAVDRELYADLCQRIISPTALEDERRWNADLDRLEFAVSSLLDADDH